MLFSVACVPFTVERGNYIDDRCRFFCNLFMKCSVKKRERRLYQSYKYPKNMIADFYINNFSKFSNDEKETVIFLCFFKQDASSFSAHTRALVSKSIKPFCNKEQLAYLKSAYEDRM